MINHIIQVAAVVPDIKVGDVNYNTEQIIAEVEKLRDCGVIVFPELSITGYTCADLFLSDILLQKSEDALFEIAKKTEDFESTIFVGVPIRFDNNLYNCGAVISRGKVLAIVPKTYIPN